MGRFKPYENSCMTAYIKNKIASMPVSDIYKPLLVDIILRRAYEYGLSQSDVILDVETLVRYVRKIEIADINNFMGLHCPKECTIKISKRVFEGNNIDYDEIYEILTHEVYHALARKDNGYDNMSLVNSYTGRVHCALLEAINSKATNRVVNRRNLLEAPYYNPTRDGYNVTAFAVDLIAATYGITERHLIQNAFKGRTFLVNYLANLSGESPNTTASYIDFMEMNLSRIHNVMFPSVETALPNSSKRGKKQIPNEVPHLSREEQIREVAAGMAGIMSATANHMNMWLVNQKRLYPQSAFAIDDQFQFSMSDINYVMDRVLDMYSNQFNYNFAPEVYEAIKRSTPAFMYNETLLNMISFRKNYRLSPEVVHRYEVEDFSDDEWDNWKIAIHIQKFLRLEHDNPRLSKAQALMRKRMGEEMIDFRFVPEPYIPREGAGVGDQQWVIRDRKSRGATEGR